MAILTISVFEFKKDDIASLPAADRRMFILSGHALNLLGMWVKMMALTVNYQAEDETLRSFNAAQAQIMLRNLIGTLVEIWRWLNRREVFEHVRDSYLSTMPTEAVEAYRSLGNRFTGSGLLSKARDSLAFHFPSDKVLDAAFTSIPESQDFNFYVSDENTNSLYFGCEAVIGYGLDSLAAKSQDGRVGMERVAHEMISAANAISEFLGALLAEVVSKYLRDKPRHHFDVGGVPGPKSGIPFLLHGVTMSQEEADLEERASK